MLLSLKSLTAYEIFNVLKTEVANISFATVEQLASRPYQSAQSTFTLGESYGSITAILGCLNIPIAPVTPAAWKAVMKLDSDKKKSIAKANELFPGMGFTSHDKAEAALLAVFGGLYFSDVFPVSA